MVEIRKGKPCVICSEKKKPQAKYCLRCNGIMNHLTEFPKVKDRIKEVRKILNIKDPTTF